MTHDDAPTAEPPSEVEAWMERFGGGDGTGSPSDSQEAGVRALREALGRPGRNREGAFALLAADGLLTRAVEEAARAEDPSARLRAILAAVAGEVPEEAG